MLRKIVFISIITCCYGGAAAFAETDAASVVEVPDANISAHQPHLSLEKTSHDFGNVNRGQKLKYRFKFSNTGESALVIQGVYASCGCTAVEVEKGKPYLPGQGGAIEVTLDTTSFTGPITKTINVMSNERLLAERILTLRATIHDEIMADPPVADLGDFFAKDGSSKSIKIRAVGKNRLDIKDLRFNQEILEANITKENDKTWRLDVRVKANVKTGFLKETVFVRNTSQDLGELPVLVRGTVKGVLELFPQYIEFGSVGPGEKSRRAVTLKGVGATDVIGSKSVLLINGEPVKDVAPFLKINTSKENAGQKSYTLELVNGGSSSKQSGSVHGKLILQTNDPNQKELPVDFYAFFR